MKIHVARLVLLGLFSFAAVGTASATQMKAPVAMAPAVQSPLQPAANPWSKVASVANAQPAKLLAHDDDRWHDHRSDWRREQWRREQARRDWERRRAWERRRDWERRHERAMHQRHHGDYRYYRR